MKYYLTLFTLLLNLYCFSQTEFEKGFVTGYKQGYCQNDYSCVSPYPPTSPTPSVNESWDNFRDGYNRGFQMGLDAKRGSGNNSNSNGYSQVVPPAKWKAPISLEVLEAGERYKADNYRKASNNVTTYLDNIYSLLGSLNKCNPNLAQDLLTKVNGAVKLINTYSTEEIYNNYNSIEPPLKAFRNIIIENLNNCD